MQESKTEQNENHETCTGNGTEQNARRRSGGRGTPKPRTRNVGRNEIEANWESGKSEEDGEEQRGREPEITQRMPR
jgi:hypothetical protein